jgi:hypothetical protein
MQAEVQTLYSIEVTLLDSQMELYVRVSLNSEIHNGGKE